MLKPTLRCDGGRFILILGLSEENLTRLQNGLAITFTGSDIGVEAVAEVIITAGRSNAEMLQPLVERGLLSVEALDAARRSDTDPAYRFQLKGGQ